MNSTTPQLNEPFPTLEILPGEILPLDHRDYERAIQISTSVNLAHQWQTYLNQMALIAVSQWLQEWGGDMAITSIPRDYALSTSEPEPVGVCMLEVGEFQCCLLVIENLIDRMIILPKTFLDCPQLASHFYIVLEIWETEQQASIRGFLRYNEFQQALRQSPLDGDLYQLPLDLFEPSSRRLVSDLQLRQANTFGLPNSTSVQQLTGSSRINVALWLQDTLDDIARHLGWGVPAPLNPVYATGWRSTEAFDAAIATLIDQGMTIPPQARGSCQTMMLQDTPFQILAAAWTLPAQLSPGVEELAPGKLKSKREEWSLLVILRTQSGDFLPHGIQLQVCDKSQILSEQTLEQDDSYLLAQVIGTSDDQFDVTISLGKQHHKLESFVYAST